MDYESIYLAVEGAIEKKLHVAYGTTPLGGCGFCYPDCIKYGNIIMRNSDCGTCRPTTTWTCEQWEERAGTSNLWKKTGIWDFTRNDNPAKNEIAYCRSSPNSAGEELHRLMIENKELKMRMRL